MNPTKPKIDSHSRRSTSTSDVRGPRRRNALCNVCERGRGMVVADTLRPRHADTRERSRVKCATGRTRSRGARVPFSWGFVVPKDASNELRKRMRQRVYVHTSLRTFYSNEIFLFILYIFTYSCGFIFLSYLCIFITQRNSTHSG